MPVRLIELLCFFPARHPQPGWPFAPPYRRDGRMTEQRSHEFRADRTLSATDYRLFGARRVHKALGTYMPSSTLPDYVGLGDF